MTEFIRPARAAILEYLYRVAAWRRAKADEYDRDLRNIRSADAIEEFAEFIADLPEDESRIVRLGQLGMEGDIFYPGQQSSYEIGRYRFFDDAGPVHHDAFLTAMVELAEKDAGNMATLVERYRKVTIPGNSVLEEILHCGQMASIDPAAESPGLKPRATPYEALPGLRTSRSHPPTAHCVRL